MSVDGSCSINLSEFSFEVGESQAHLSGLGVGEDLDGSLVDGTSGRESEVGGGFGDVDGEHLGKKGKDKERVSERRRGKAGWEERET